MSIAISELSFGCIHMLRSGRIQSIYTTNPFPRQSLFEVASKAPFDQLLENSNSRSGSNPFAAIAKPPVHFRTNKAQVRRGISGN